MRNIICVVISLIIMMGTLGGCAGSNAGESEVDEEAFYKQNTQFAFDIFSKLNEEDADKNIFVSPLSISTSLSMALQGAETSTKAGMMQALRYNGTDLDYYNKCYKSLLSYLVKPDKKVDLDIGNSIWIREGKKSKKDFININKNIFNAYVEEIDFSQANAADKINKWIEKSTKNKIPAMIESPIPDDVFMYLVNCIYFNGEWTEKFDKDKTSSEQFYSGNGQVKEVMMMRRRDKMDYGEKENEFKVVRLPYGKGKTAMYCVLPDEKISINDFIKSLNAEKWDEIQGSIHEDREVLLYIPRFKIEYGVKELKNVLVSMGMEEAFSLKAKFNGISDSEIYISDVLHKAVIEVSEEGSKAFAVNIVVNRKKSAPEFALFAADRPFLFFITEETTGTILFMGKMYDAEKY